MPKVNVRKLGKKYRLVEEGTRRIARTEGGKARDGGGHRSRAKAGRQKGYINTAMENNHG